MRGLKSGNWKVSGKVGKRGECRIAFVIKEPMVRDAALKKNIMSLSDIGCESER